MVRYTEKIESETSSRIKVGGRKFLSAINFKSKRGLFTFFSVTRKAKRDIADTVKRAITKYPASLFSRKVIALRNVTIVTAKRIVPFRSRDLLTGSLLSSAVYGLEEGMNFKIIIQRAIAIGKIATKVVCHP
jgi:hypothetical protein